jgi:hypothetical protein
VGGFYILFLFCTVYAHSYFCCLVVLPIIYCRPPVASCAEFEVERIVIPSSTEPRSSEGSAIGTVSYSIDAVPCGSLMLLVSGGDGITLKVSKEQGEGENSVVALKTGSVVFVEAGETISVALPAGASADFYRAHVNLG